MQNGYATSGLFNGPCFVEYMEELAPDYVVMPEGDSMHANTGNRDAVGTGASAKRRGPPSPH
jgi:hypothetical protein